MHNSRIIFPLLLFFSSPTNVFCQTSKGKSNISSVAKKNVKREKVHPRVALLNKVKKEEQKAMLWAMLLPCGGQIYNKTYWTAAAFASSYAVAGFFTWFWHKRYIEAGLFKLDNYEVNNSGIVRSSERYRTMGLITLALIYAFGVVEAYSTASLKTFDISDDLSFVIEPKQNDKEVGLNFGLNFK